MLLTHGSIFLRTLFLLTLRLPLVLVLSSASMVEPPRWTVPGTVTPTGHRSTPAALEEALKTAWRDYGPGKVNTGAQLPKQRFVRSQDEEMPILLSPYFQPMTSEWDSLVSFPTKVYKIPVPGVLNYILSSYIRLQVNYGEEITELQKIGLGILAGTLLGSWILLGFPIGGIPLKWIFSRTEMYELSIIAQRILDLGDKEVELRGLEGRVKSAINGKWLENLKILERN